MEKAMKKLIIVLIALSSVTAFAENIEISAGKISIGSCTVGVQGVQDTPYAELEITYPKIDIQTTQAPHTSKDSAFTVFIGSKIDHASLTSRDIKKTIRFYQIDSLSAADNCKLVRSQLLTYGMND